MVFIAVFVMFSVWHDAFALFPTYAAYQAYEKGDYALARQKFGALVADNPHDWQALFNLGTISLQEKKFEDAIRHFEKSLHEYPDNPEAQSRLKIAQEQLQQQQQQQKEQQNQQDQNNQQKEQQGDGSNDQSDASQRDASQPDSPSQQDAQKNAQAGGQDNGEPSDNLKQLDEQYQQKAEVSLKRFDEQQKKMLGMVDDIDRIAQQHMLQQVQMMQGGKRHGPVQNW